MHTRAPVRRLGNKDVSDALVDILRIDGTWPPLAIFCKMSQINVPESQSNRLAEGAPVHRGAWGNLQHALRQLLVAAPDLEDARVRGWQHGHHPCALTHAGASPPLQLQLPCSSIRQREAGRWGSHDWASAQAQCGAADSMWVQLFDSSPAAQRTCKCVECVVLVVVDPVHGCDELCSGCAQRWWLLRSILEVRQKQRRTTASLGGVDYGACCWQPAGSWLTCCKAPAALISAQRLLRPHQSGHSHNTADGAMLWGPVQHARMTSVSWRGCSHANSAVSVGFLPHARPSTRRSPARTTG